jgi:hypothetical protein
MRLALEVLGEPAACASAAEELHALGDAAGEAADALVGQARVDEAGFGGLSGDAFRQHVRRLVEPADDLGRRSHRLADALVELSRDLRDVRRAMELARQVARPLLVVTDHEIHSPPDAAQGAEAGEAARAWDEAVRIVDAARQLEDRAQQDWRGALDRFALGTEGLSPYQPLLQSHLPPLTPAGDEPGPQPPPGPGPATAPGPTTPPSTGSAEGGDGAGAGVRPAIPSPATQPSQPTPTTSPTGPSTAGTMAGSAATPHGVAAGRVGVGHDAAPAATAGVPADPPTCAGIPTVPPSPLEGTWAAAPVRARGEAADQSGT